MKKRNRRTVIMAHVKLAPLTEHILEQMGEEGNDIRKRLTLFYRQRASQNCCHLGNIKTIPLNPKGH